MLYIPIPQKDWNVAFVETSGYFPFYFVERYCDSSNTNNLALWDFFFAENTFYTYAAMGTGSYCWVAANPLLQTILKKSKTHKAIIFENGT